jgi:Flp pilus assembly pilin Flp
MSILLTLLRDDRGFLASSELILIATIVVIGLITGLVTVRDQVIQELADVADAVSEFDQSYSWSQITTTVGSVAGSVFVDAADFCEQAGNVSDQGTGPQGAPVCINMLAGAAPE